MASVTIVNNGKALLCVLAEPLGEDFWIAPDQTLTFTTPDHKARVSWYEGIRPCGSTTATHTT